MTELLGSQISNQERHSIAPLALARPRTTWIWISLMILSLALFSTTTKAQSSPSTQVATDYSKAVSPLPYIYRSYQKRSVPPPDIHNSNSVSGLIHGGTMQLSVAQLVNAVVENNLDIASARYNTFYSETDLLRVQAGSAPRGSQGITIPTGLFTGAIGAGLSSDTGATTGGGGGGSISTSARAISLTPRGTFDPLLTMIFSVDRITSPLNSLRVSGVSISSASTAAFQSRYAQSFRTGTSFTLNFNAQRDASNQRFLRFQPSLSSGLTVSVVQQLLNGFGTTVNGRFDSVAKTGLEIAKENFRQQVLTTLAQAENSYWDLVALRETVRVAETSLQVSQKLYEDNKKQADVGTLAPLDVIAAESEVAGRQRDLIIAQTNLQQAEIAFKTLLSKEINSDLASARVELTDVLPTPSDSDIPKLEEALAAAQKNRPEISQAEGNLMNQDIAVKFTKNAMLPTLNLFGRYASSGLYGDQTIAGSNGGAPIVIPGGLSNAISQVFHSNFPEYAVGFSLSFSLRNRSAQADNIRARLEQQQSETAIQRTRNQITLEVRNAVIALAQAKAQVAAAEKAVERSKEQLDAEQKKLAAGVSTPYNVVLNQRDLLAAQLSAVQARAGYAKARVEIDRSTGMLLEKSHVDPALVPRGQILSR